MEIAYNHFLKTLKPPQYCYSEFCGVDEKQQCERLEHDSYTRGKLIRFLLLLDDPAQGWK